jgi:riboflavin synthase
MFTGIIEELGRVLAIEQQPDAIRLTIGATKVLSDLGRGDSISCSGTCLTAIEIDDKGFTADVMLETLKRTSLSEVKVGDPVNLERAMNATTRYGGHVVQGR